MWFFAFIVAFLLIAPSAFATPSVGAIWRYERAYDARVVTDLRTITLPSIHEGASVSTDPGIAKTIFLVDVVNGVRKHLKQYDTQCRWRDNSRVVPECTAVKDLRDDINSWNARILANGRLRSDQELGEMLDVMRVLAKNMEIAPRPAPRFEHHRSFTLGGPLGAAPTFAGGGLLAFATGGGLAVTGGGAQDYAFFRKLVQNREVPKADMLTVEGFLREFELPIVFAPACRELVCVNPAAFVDWQKGRLYVQLGMNSAVTPQTFHRKPLNLSVVLDVSGSMAETDDTEKSRLEWAKDALIRTINELDANDYLSIVLFDTNSEVLLRPERVRDKARIIAMVKPLMPRGSTNLEAGLRDGYVQASRYADSLSGYEQRVILISDAGLNTGVTDTTAILRLVTDSASRGIGLTTLGLGENFKQDFIHAITNSRGGNYVFVHSGKDMQRYFEAFDFLVTPIAYNFRVQVKLTDIQAKLVAAYGVATEAGMQPVRDLIDMPTLFFSGEGGAILLEYEINSSD